MSTFWLLLCASIIIVVMCCTGVVWLEYLEEKRDEEDKK